jgi:WD40 repeat protein
MAVPLYSQFECLQTLKLPNYSSIALSATGETLLFCTDKTVKIWDIQSRSLLRTLEAREFIKQVYLSRSGQFLLSRHNDSKVTVWNLHTNRKVGQIQIEGNENLPSQALSQDGQFLATYGPSTYFPSLEQSQQTVRVWHVQTGVELLTFQIPSAVTGVALSADGKLVAVGNETDDGGTIAVWNVETQQMLHQIEAITYRIERSTYYNPYSDADTDPTPRGVISVAIHPCSPTLVCGIREGESQVWNLQTGQKITTLKGSNAARFLFTQDPQTVVAGNRIWSLQTGKVLREFDIHITAINQDASIALASNSFPQIWDLQRDREIPLFFGHQKAITALVVTPDGNTFISGSADHTLKTWSIDGVAQGTLNGHMGGITALKMSSDGNTLISSSQDTEIKLWNWRQGRVLQTLRGRAGTVHSLALSSDGKRLVSGCDNNTLQIWELPDGRLQQTVKLQNTWSKQAIRCLAIAPDGQTLIVAGSDPTIRFWDLHTMQEIRWVPGHRSEALALAISPDGQWFATSARSQPEVKLWTVATGEVVHTMTLSNSNDCISALVFSPDSKTLVTGILGQSSSAATPQTFWDVATGQSIHTLTQSTNPTPYNWFNNRYCVSAIAFTPDGQTLITGDENRAIRLWGTPRNLQQSTPLAPDPAQFVGNATTQIEWMQTLRGHTHAISAIVFSPDHQLLVSASQDRDRCCMMIKIWDLRTGQELTTLKQPEYDQHPVLYRQNHTTTTITKHGVITLTDSVSQQSTYTLTDLAYSGRAISHNGQVFASPHSAHQTITGRTLCTLTTGDTSTALSANGQLLVSSSGGRHHNLQIWNVRTGQLLRTISGHRCGDALLVTPPGSSGERIIRGTDNGFIEVWDLQTDAELHYFKAHARVIQCLAVSPDGQRLASGGNDGMIQLWDLQTGENLAKLEGHTSIVSTLAFSSDGTTLASGSWDNTIRLWQVGAI